MIGRPTEVDRADQILHTLQAETPRGGERHIIDELIDERAKKLSRIPFLWETLRLVFDPLFGYRTAVEWADRLASLPAADALDLLDRLLPIQVRCHGLHHVPADGPIVILANHPTGMVDGFAVREALKPVRTDLSYFANRDAIRIAPGFQEIVIPIEWLVERRNPMRMRETLQALKAAIEKGHAIVMFPAGGMAKLTLHGLKELPWLQAAIKLIQKNGLPAIPLHIDARNSWVYYLFSMFHDELRDLTRFHEIQDKRNRIFELTFGQKLTQKQLAGLPELVTRQIQRHVEYGLPKAAKAARKSRT